MTTPKQYLLDNGLDFAAIKDIAAKGPSDADVTNCQEIGLDPAKLASYCRDRVAESRSN